MAIKIEDISKANEDAIQHIHEEGARNALVINNQGLVRSIASRFRVSSYLQDELVSVGIVGLVKASQTFNVLSDVKFATYAATCIRNEILMFLRREKKHRHSISDQTPVAQSKDDEPVFLETFLSDSNATSAFEEVNHSDDYDRQIFIGMVYLTATENEKHVLTHWARGLKQREISSEIREGLSQSYISRLQMRIAKKVRELKAKIENHGGLSRIPKEKLDAALAAYQSLLDDHVELPKLVRVSTDNVFFNTAIYKLFSDSPKCFTARFMRVAEGNALIIIEPSSDVGNTVYLNDRGVTVAVQTGLTATKSVSDFYFIKDRLYIALRCQ